jgi:hypothetical protein
MSLAEAAWSMPWKALHAEAVQEALRALGAEAPGLRFELEREEADTLTAHVFLDADESGAARHFELSFYDLDRDGVILCLEPEWADNAAHWEEAWDLCDTVAEAVGGEVVDLSE